MNFECLVGTFDGLSTATKRSAGMAAGRECTQIGHDFKKSQIRTVSRGHAGAFYRADVNEHDARTLRRSDESKTRLSVEKFDSPYGRRGLLFDVIKTPVRISDDADTAEIWELT